MSKLTVSIPDDLHQKIREELEKQGITTSQFIEQAVINFFENPKGEPNMATRTLAFQVSEELFQRVKAYLARYEEIHHRRLSQKEFVIGLIKAELDESDEEFEAAEAAAAAESSEVEQAAEEPEIDDPADEDTPATDEAEECEDATDQQEVDNHTSPDSWLAQHHPEWFYHKPDGSFGNKVGEWLDVVDLDYSQRGLWDYQIETLKQWAEIVDGFRCDVAPLIPLEFWLRARQEVETVHPGCFWLSESVEPIFTVENRARGLVSLSDSEIYQAFDVSYEYDIFAYFKDGPIPQSTYSDGGRGNRYGLAFARH